jgi:hypothetical protein
MIYAIPPRQSLEKDTHSYYDNFLTEEEINTVLAMPEWLNADEACVGGQSSNQIHNKDMRSTKVAWIGLTPKTAWLWEKISNKVADVNNRFFKFNDIINNSSCI